MKPYSVMWNLYFLFNWILSSSYFSNKSAFCCMLIFMLYFFCFWFLDIAFYRSLWHPAKIFKSCRLLYIPLLFFPLIYLICWSHLVLELILLVFISKNSFYICFVRIFTISYVSLCLLLSIIFVVLKFLWRGLISFTYFIY